MATGARAFVPPIEGAEHAIISDDILDLPELPGKIAVVGGGYIALEFAGIYNNFGTEVHVLFRQVLRTPCPWLEAHPIGWLSLASGWHATPFEHAAGPSHSCERQVQAGSSYHP